MANAYFTVYDYIVLLLVFITSMAIGLTQVIPKGYLRKKFKVIKRKLCKKNDTENEQEEHEMEEIENEKEKEDENQIDEYLIANKTIHIIPAACSILASTFSTNTLIGMVSEVYLYGMQINVCILPDTIAAFLAAYIFMPILRKLDLVTMTEYFQIRFNSKFVRIISIVSYALSLLLWNAMIIYGTGTSLSSVTGIDVFWTMTILGVITIIYTVFGGMRGVIWTDVFQLTVIFGGLIFIMIKGSYDVGGIDKVWKIGYEGGRINFFDFRPNPFIRQTFWTILFGDLITSTLDYNTDQTIVQRFAVTSSVKKAQHSLLLTALGYAFIVFMSGFTGLIIYATYADCDPLVDPNIDNLEDENQLLAYYITDKLNAIPGIAGFIIGAVVSAASSSLSSSLNGLAAIILKDCSRHIDYFRKLNDSKSLRFVKILVLVLGIVSILLSYIFASIGGNLIAYTYIVDGAVTGPIYSLFIMGTCFYFANTPGAIVGSTVTLIVGIWMLVGEAIVEPDFATLPLECERFNVSFSNITDSGEADNLSGFDIFYSISFHLFVLIVNSIGLIIGLIVSLLTGGLKNVVPNDLVLFNRKPNKISNINS